MDQSKSVVKRYEELLDSGKPISADEFLSAESTDLDRETVSQVLRMEIERASREQTFENNTEFNIQNDEHSLLFYLSQDDASASFRSAVSEPVFEIPNPFGKFELLEALGSGGMGLVFKARQSDVKRFVAIKVIRPDIWIRLTDQKRFELRARISNEAEIGSSVTHPNVVTIYETGDVGGIPYVSMQLIEGQTLLQKIREPGVGVSECARIFASVARGLECLHESGAIHRDVTPRNIFLTSSGEVVLGDFGLAKTTCDAGDLTQENAVLGTISYASPEQIKDARNVDRRSDVYGLGASLYHCLAQRPPFTGESDSEKLSKILLDSPVPISTLDSSIAKDIEAVCLKCIEKKPEHRYQSATDFAADLDSFLEGRPTTARPIGRLGQLSKWFGREPVVGWLSVLSFLLILAVGLVSAIGWRNSTSSNRELQKSIQQKDNNQLLAADLMEKMLSITNGQLKTSSKNSKLHEEFIVAMADYAQSFSNEDEFGNYNYINARVNQTLAGLLSRNGQHDEAIRHFSLADEYLEKSDRKDDLKNRMRSDIAMNRSNHHKLKAEHHKALEFVDQALAFLDKSDSTKKALKRASALSEKCLLLSQVGKVSEARKLADSVFSIANEVEGEMLSVNDYLSFGLINKRLLHVISQNEKVSEREYLLPRFKQQHQYWQQVNERSPDNHWARLELAASLVPLGTISKSDPKSSLKYREQAYETYRQLVNDKPADPTANKGLIISATSLMAANLDLPGGSVDRAGVVFEEANVIGAKVIGKPHSVDTRMSYTDFRGTAALVAIRKTDFAAARGHTSYVIEILRNLVKAKPQNQQAKSILLENLNQHAFLEINDEKLESARSFLDEARSLLPELTAPYSGRKKMLGVAFVDLALAFKAKDQDELYSENMIRGLELSDYDIKEKYLNQFLDYLQQESKYAAALQIIKSAIPKIENKALAEKLNLRLRQIEEKD